jgi:flagellar protein FliO/FliZ
MSILWFIAIVAMIPLALWLLKRSPYGASLGATGTGSITRTVSSMALSPSQRIVTIEVGAGDAKQWLVLGVTPQNITTLHTMVPQELGTTPAAGPVSFASLLSKMHKRGE